ncbi:MAG TPA: ABC transporter permease [Candidatus Limnocylindrales bacterium]|nr:ABC transporter permease [Candidatus Limnocylindrales bacterium]
MKPIVRWFRRHDTFWLPVTSLLMFLAAWQFASTTGIVQERFFSSPVGVVQAGIKTVQDDRFWNDVSISGSEFAVGYAAAVIVAIPFGVVAALYRRLGYAVEPFLNGLNATPRIALLPLIVLWAGIGWPATTVTVFIGVFMPIAINAFYAVRTVDRGLLTVANHFGASQRRKLRTLVLPSVVPFVLAGARLGIGRGVLGVVIGEFYSSTSGLGNFIFVAGSTLQIDKIIFGALFMTTIALVAFIALERVERRVGSWRPDLEFGT